MDMEPEENNQEVDSNVDIVQKNPLLESNVIKIQRITQNSDEKKANAMQFSTARGRLHQALITLAVNLITSAYGISLGYSAIFLPQIRSDNEALKMSPEMESWFATTISIAAPVGCYVSGYLMDRYGRRTTLMFTAIPIIIGWLIMGLAKTHFMLFLGRWIVGAFFGLSAAAYQVYLAECSDAHIRSISMNTSFVALSVGILIVYWLGSNFHWHLIALYNVILPAMAFIALYLSPESPIWLVRNGRLDDALVSAKWLRGNAIIAGAEIKEISNRIENEENIKLGFWKELRAHSSLKPFVILNILIVLINLSGSYLFVFYAVDIVAGLDKSIDSFKLAIVTAGIRLIVNIIFCPLFYYIKRRPIFIFSGLTAGVGILLLAIHLYVSENRNKDLTEIQLDYFLMLIYIAFSTTFMIAPGFMIGELLSSKVRARTAGYLNANYSLSFFIFAKFLPYVNTYFKVYTVFFIFGLASLVSTFLIYLFIPETKGQSLNEIEDYFKQEHWMYRKQIASGRAKIKMGLIENNSS